MIMKLRNIFIHSIAAMSLLVVAVAPTHAFEVSSSTINQATKSDRSYLNGEFVNWNGQGELVTSIGTYSVANVYVNDRAGTRASNYKAGETTPQVTLEFFSGRLTKVTIY